MKVIEAIKAVNRVKPNAFTKAEKIRWLNHLEGRVAAEVFLLAQVEIERLTLTKESEEWELLVKPPYDDIYTSWLAAQIDLANGETNKYQNSMEQFNQRYASFVAWFANLYEPARGVYYPTGREEPQP